jgi:glycosyltransferase involved in cell wall biosynthesis/GNAT superfamily N-acetyltransferase
VVHTHSPLPAAVARLLPTARGAAFVHTEHSAWTRYASPTRLANLVTFGRNRQVFAISEGVARSIRRPRWALRVQMPPVEVLYHGIDTDDVRRGPDARRAGRALLDLPDDAVVLGTVGNLVAKKDHRGLIEAFHLLADDRPALHLVVVGGGVLEDELRSQAAATGLADRIHLLGQRPDVAALLPGFDVFALGSRHEGLGLSLIEAMASGVPVVATEVDGVPEVVTHDVDGLLVPPGRPDALAGAVADLLDDPERASRLVAAGLASATRFSIPAAVARMQHVYDSVLRDEAPLAAPRPPTTGHRRARTDDRDVTIRRATPDDDAAVLALLDLALGGGPTGRRSPELFAWKHRQNPFGPSDAFVAELDGELVGYRTFMRWRWRAGPRLYDAVRAVDTATHPDHAGRGIFTRLTMGALDEIGTGADLVFNTPNDKSRPGYLKMGWTQVGVVPVAIRPVHPVRFARGFRDVRSNAAAPVIACALDPAGDVLADPRIGDLISESMVHDGRIATDTSVDHLRWRYDAPGLDYRAVAVERGGALAAVAIGRPRARGRLAELTLSEVIVRPGDRSAADEVLGAVIRASGCDHVATVVRPGLGLAGVHRAHGFLPVPGRGGMVLTVRPIGAVAPDPRRPSSWSLALGDLEVF